MSDELEQRLRDALHAYADHVDVPDDGSLPASTTAGRPALRRWRGAILAAAAAAAVVIGSVWIGTNRSSDAPSAAAGSAVSAHEDTAAAAPGSSGAPGAAASGGPSADAAVPAEGLGLPTPVQVGMAYVVDLPTHCGIRGIDVDGVWFAADPPLVEAGGNPPPGWGNPTQRGTVTLQTRDTAVFRDERGHEVRMRAAESARPAPCD